MTLLCYLEKENLQRQSVVIGFFVILFLFKLQSTCKKFCIFVSLTHGEIWLNLLVWAMTGFKLFIFKFGQITDILRSRNGGSIELIIDNRHLVLAVIITQTKNHDKKNDAFFAVRLVFHCFKGCISLKNVSEIFRRKDVLLEVQWIKETDLTPENNIKCYWSRQSR